MKVSKKIAVPAAALCIIGAGFYGVTQASATSSSNSKKSLAQEIAQAFNIDQSKVQSVINQHKSETQASREANYETRLAQAVTDGKLTAAQKDAVLAEHTKLAAELKTGKDRRAAVKQVLDEGKAWAQANNIDAKWLVLTSAGRLRGGGNPAPTASPQA